MSPATTVRSNPGSDTATVSGPGRRRRPAGWWWFALPSAALVLVFFVGPFVLNVGFAFTAWSGYASGIRFTGLDNVRALLDQGVLVHAIVVTAAYAVIAMAIQNAVSLPLAVALQRTTRTNEFFRSVFFIPVLISPVAAGYIWAAILAPHGPLDDALSTLLPGDVGFAWLGHSTSALVAVAFIDAWKWSGVITLVYIAGLKSIPAALLEAARIDGAGRWQLFRHVTFPLLAPAFTFNVVVTLVGAFSAYDVVMATTVGGPGNATTVLNVAMWRQWGMGFFGTASAISLTVTLMVVLTAVPLVAWLRTREIDG